MSAKVDVLAVMRRMHLQANACRSGGAGSGTQDFEDESAITAVAKLMEVVQSIADDCRRGAHEHGMTPAGVQDIAARCDATLANIGPQS